jgi:hypothetical protein
MSADQAPQDHISDEHITHLLSAYIHNWLASDGHSQVQAHLADCAKCRDDYALATAVIAGAQRQLQAIPAPSVAVLDRVWREIDAPTPSVAVIASVVEGRARRLWRLTRAQPPLIPKGIWVASAGAVFVAVLIASLWRDGAFPPSLLGLLLAPVAAAGVAFLGDQDADPALEIALATPTSPRTTLFCRFLLVYGYNTVLALSGSLLLTVAQHTDFLLLASYWVGPMLLLASIGLVLTVRFGAFVGAIAIGALWCLRVLGLVLAPLQTANEVDTSLPVLWRTSPTLVLVAVILLVVAALTLPTEINTARDH